MTRGIKHDTGKAIWAAVPPNAMRKVAEVMTGGAIKYSLHNYALGMKATRLISAAHRHLNAFECGENIDAESGLPHLAHLACCALMVLEQTIQATIEDDRLNVFLTAHKTQKEQNNGNQDSNEISSTVNTVNEGDPGDEHPSEIVRAGVRHPCQYHASRGFEWCSRCVGCNPPSR